MPEKLLSYSIRELRRRYVSETADCPTEILQQMRNDPRGGVRKIYRQLQRQVNQERKESERLNRLLVWERRLWGSGVSRIAGVDEAGIGPLAGPVVAAAVVFPPATIIPGIDDSKRLTAHRRSSLALEIRKQALSVNVGISTVEEIDRLNIYQAGLLAMKRALVGLSVEPEHILVDGRNIPGLSQPQQRLVKGDQRSFVIAAASIIAKTRRDELMSTLDEEYPGYGFAQHKGYGTVEHREALKRLGPAAPHRRSFALLRNTTPLLFDDLSSGTGR
jgi:ribonuclease HII